MLKTIKETILNNERTELVKELWLNLSNEEKAKYSEGFHEYRFIQESIYEYYYKPFMRNTWVALLFILAFLGIIHFLATYYHDDSMPLLDELVKFAYIAEAIIISLILLLFAISFNKNDEIKRREHYGHIVDVIHKDFGEKYDLFLGIESEHQELNKDNTKSYLVVVKEIDDTSENNK